jgi:hypothetical protein
VDLIDEGSGTPTAIYDLKTGNARLTDKRVAKIRAQLPPEWGYDVPIIQIKPVRDQ